MRIAAFLFVLFFVPAALPAQSAAAAAADTVQRLADAGFLHDDLASFAAARAAAARGLTRAPNDGLLLHYAGYVHFRTAVLHLQSGKGEGVRGRVGMHLDSAEHLLGRSSAVHPLPETYALLSSVQAMRAATGSPLAALGQVRRSSAAMEQALELGPANPRVWLLRGIAAAQTPRLMGGGAERARGYLERALALFAADPARPPAPRWGRGEVHAWLGVVHARSGRLKEARRAYEAALRVEPEAVRVRNVLVPRLARAEARARGETQP